MINSKKSIFTILSVIAVGLVAAIGVAAFNAHTTLAAGALQATPPPGSSAATTGASAYQDLFLQSLAKRLNTDVTTLKSAMSGASDDVLAQAVKDGKLTQAQADAIKSQLATKMQNGNLLELPFLGGGRGGHGRGGMGFGEGLNEMNLINDVASALKMQVTDLETQLQAGKSIADVAKAQNVDLATVKQSVLDAEKATLDQAVKDGKLTQAQADSEYQKLTASIDTLLSGKMNFGRMGGFGKGFEFGLNGMNLINDVASALKMQVSDLETQLQGGKTIADIAKAQNVDLATLKQSDLDSEKATLDQAVKDGKLTQAQADTEYQNLSTKIDNMLNGTMNFGKRGGPGGSNHGMGGFGFKL